jgi:hypothetical protein
MKKLALIVAALVSLIGFPVMVALSMKATKPEPIVVSISPPIESAEPPVALDPLSPDDARLFERLKAHIDARVEQRLVESVKEAASDKVGGIGTMLAAAMGQLVMKIVKAVVAGLVLAAIVALLWKYGVIIWFVVSVIAAPAGWLGSKVSK